SKYPQLDYYQGMNFIAASLSIHCSSPLAVRLFEFILNDLKLAHYYRNSLELIEKVTGITKKIIDNFEKITGRKGKGSLKKKLEALDVTPEHFVPSWALTLFSHLVPLEYSERLWGIIFSESWEGFFKIIVAIFSL